jgi:hypothetical protein
MKVHLQQVDATGEGFCRPVPATSPPGSRATGGVILYTAVRTVVTGHSTYATVRAHDLCVDLIEH